MKKEKSVPVGPTKKLALDKTKSMQNKKRPAGMGNNLVTGSSVNYTVTSVESQDATPKITGLANSSNFNQSRTDKPGQRSNFNRPGNQTNPAA